MTSGRSSSPEQIAYPGGDLGRQRTRDPYADTDDNELYDAPLRDPTTHDEQHGGSRQGTSGSGFR
jgi:hypothetical protein